MDDHLLDELERLERAATPGPWSSSVEGRDHWSGDNVIIGPRSEHADADVYVWIRVGDDGWHPAAVADQDLIAAMRNALPTLIAEIRRMRSGDDGEPPADV